MPRPQSSNPSGSKPAPMVFKNDSSISNTVPKNGFANSVKEGFALGIGVSIARNIVDRIFTPTIEHKVKTPYEMCMEQTKQDKEACELFKKFKD